MSSEDFVPDAEVARTAPEPSREYISTSEEDFSDEYTPEEIAKIIARANVILMRLRSIIHNSDEYSAYKLTSIGKKISNWFIMFLSALSLAFIVIFVIINFGNDDLSSEQRLLVWRALAIISLFAISITFGLLVYRLYKERNRVVFLEQARLLASRIESLLSRLEKKNA